MSEQQDVIEAFGDAGVLDGIRWAYESAASRVMEDYSEADGHDATWAGMTRFTLFRDRLDRVFTCERYAIPPGTDDGVSLDLLHAALTDRDIDTMPMLAPGLVSRADLNGSPGWGWQNWRWLLAAAPLGKIDELPWPRKSQTKQRVARQPDPSPAQPSLFDGIVDGEVGGLQMMLDAALKLDRETLVVAHSQDVDHGGRELVVGRARLNSGGGTAWHWKQSLLMAPPPEGGRRLGDAPMAPGPDPVSVADAPVRLRRPASTRPADRASGEQ